MITAISWRNIWRNPRRSLVIIIASILGVTMGIFMLGFMFGWVNQRIYDVIHVEYANVQVHEPKFKENYELTRSITEAEHLQNEIRNIDGVSGVSSRLMVNAMLKTTQENFGATVLGVDPDAEREVSEVPEMLIYGKWFESESANRIVLSERTAKRMGVIVFQLRAADLDTLLNEGLDEELVSQLDTFTSTPQLLRMSEYTFDKKIKDILGNGVDKELITEIKDRAYHIRKRVSINLMVQDSSGEFHEESFKLEGLYRTNNTMFDEMNVYVRKEKLAEMTKLSVDDAHEIAVKATDNETTDMLAEKVAKIADDMLVETWMDLDPMSKFYSESMNLYTYVFMGIILLALFFGIVNTMLMAVLERIKEIGMLKAVGMNSRKVFSMIVLESVFLTMVGSLIGIVFGLILVYIFGIHPINLTAFAEGLEGFGFAAKIYTSIDFDQVISISILCAMTGILASIVPAVKAVKLKPVDAIRIE